MRCWPLPVRNPILLSVALAATLAADPQFKVATPAVPPSSASKAPPTFSLHVNLVRLPVAVLDSNGAPVSGLTQDDFEILDGGVRQRVSFFTRNTSAPLSIPILIDTSASTIIDLHYEVDSVLKFVPALLNSGNPEDTFALFSFNWRTNLESDYSRNLKRAERALHTLKGDGGTSMYDAIYLACSTLEGRDGRHAMVVVTDGGDTTSYKHFEDALAAAQRANAVLYPIVAVPIEGDAGRNLGGEHALATLANSTGGRIFFPDGFDKLDQAFAQILEDLRTQYLLGYYPANVDERSGSFHAVSVHVKRNDWRVRTRSGYYEP